MDLRFGFSMNPADLDEVRAVAGQAEQDGYDRVGVWDSPALFHDPWVVLASLAIDTSRLRLGTWVTNPLTRHPVVTASAASALDALAPGRVVLGIGTGDSGVYNLARTAAPLEVLSEYVTAVRGLLESGRATWQGGELRMRPAANPVPIWVAAHGARAIRTAGAIADGVIFGLGLSSDVVSACFDMLGRGAEAAGRDPDGIEAWFTAPWCVDDDAEAARSEAIWRVTSLAHHISRSGAAGKFLPEEYRAGILRLGESYDLSTHGDPTAEQRERYRLMAEREGVADYLVDRFAIAGTPEDCAAQVLRIAATGATRLDCANDSPPGGLNARPERWARDVMPRLPAREKEVAHA